jgi:FkbM family methyltransferase
MPVWSEQLKLYRRESRRLTDFVSLMRVRLSQSKLGPWTTPKPIVVDVDLNSLGSGIHLRSHTTDISVLAEISDGHTLTELPDGLAPKTIVDLGANIGLSYRWLRRQYPDARFVCVEPDPGNLEILRANVRSSGGDCTVVGACIGGHARKVKLTTTEGEWGFRLSDVDDPSQASTHVVTMQQVLDDAAMDRVDILKCDIEGAEVELFADCGDWIDRVDNIVIECHTDVMDTEGVAEALARNGASFEVVHVTRVPDCGYETAMLRRITA